MDSITFETRPNFQMTDSRAAVPAGAIVFAICDGTRAIENQDEDIFAAMADEDFYALRAMVNEAKRLETQRERAAASARPVRKVYRWLLTLLFGQEQRELKTVCAGSICGLQHRQNQTCPALTTRFD